MKVINREFYSFNTEKQNVNSFANQPTTRNEKQEDALCNRVDTVKQDQSVFNVGQSLRDACRSTVGEKSKSLP
jgi:hypothetical protein